LTFIRNNLITGITRAIVVKIAYINVRENQTMMNATKKAVKKAPAKKKAAAKKKK
jgi:hypothetical protein